jgi:hypothetical protein
MLSENRRVFGVSAPSEAQIPNSHRGSPRVMTSRESGFPAGAGPATINKFESLTFGFWPGGVFL